MNEFILFALIAFFLVSAFFCDFYKYHVTRMTCNHEKLEKIGETTVYDLDMNVSHEYKLKCINCEKIITVVKDGK